MTRVISRVTLQQILAKACTRVAGEDVILNDCRVVNYVERVSHSSKTVQSISMDKLLACGARPCMLHEGWACCISVLKRSVQRRIREF